MNTVGATWRKFRARATARALRALSLFALCGLLLATTSEAQTVTEDDASPASPPPPTVENATPDPLPVEDIRVLVEVFHKIKADYVERVSDKKLLENAIKGMLAGLDPHSAYLDPEDYADLQEGTTGEFGGLGIEVGTEDGFIKVIAPIDDTPAQRAGVQPGDVIIRLDDTPVKGMQLNDAIGRMRGKPGSTIELTIVREGEEKPVKISITRDVIKIRSVRSRILEPGFGYLRVSHFQGRTGNDFVKEITALKKSSADKLKGVILDLRNNPGGVLGAAVSVSDAFLNSGLIVYTEGRIKDAQLEFNATPPDLIDGAPLIVMVNEGSASASEIVAGALQDRKRAVIVGRQTFGKGSVQTILPMNNEAALKMTTARYFTPAGRSIQAEGVQPDITIDKVTVSALGDADATIVKEADLDRHLENATENDKSATMETKSVDALRRELATNDYELFEALNLLKGMVLLQARSNTTTLP